VDGLGQLAVEPFEDRSGERRDVGLPDDRGGDRAERAAGDIGPRRQLLAYEPAVLQHRE
jgi:hypothetical protein